MHDNSLLLFKKYALGYFQPGTRVLEVGGSLVDSKFRACVGDRTIKWETLDIAPRPGVVYVAKSEYDYDLPDATFDVVLACQVLEHVRHPWRWFKELSRLLKSGGHLITISPVSWPYHEAPVDCWRAYPCGLRALCDESGLAPIVCTYESLEALRYWRTFPGCLLYT
ncbi:MAG: class I SAM-dependent methyltransferase, partial [Verrucomicrobiae bacterium]|nr:class I SAM-dependent methyltransferase [Verrucomicrobiae bacterium]